MLRRLGSGLSIGVVIAAAAFAFVFSLVGPAAEAFPTGQVAHTGSPVVGAATCASCHQDSGLSASLSIDAPTSMQVNETTTVTITVRGGPGVVAGFNAASDMGTLLVPGPGAQFVQGEVTHVAPQPFSNGQAEFRFDWQAPAEATTVVWYAAAVSADADDATTGDAVATTQLSISIQPAPTPTLTPSSTNPSTSSGTSDVISTSTPANEPVATAVPTPALPSSVDAGAFGFGLSPHASSALATSTDAGADATGTGSDAGLAVTGSDVAFPAALSVVLFASGAATMVAGRRRQR